MNEQNTPVLATVNLIERASEESMASMKESKVLNYDDIYGEVTENIDGTQTLTLKRQPDSWDRHTPIEETEIFGYCIKFGLKTEDTRDVKEVLPLKFGSVKDTIQTIPRRHLNFAIVDISWDIKSHTDAMERLKTLKADFGDHIRLISAHECRRWLAELGDTVDTSSITFITNDESVILPGKLKSDPVLIATVFVENNSTLLNHG